MAALLPISILKQLSVSRAPIYPVSVGETLSLTLELTAKPKAHRLYFQCQDQIPASFDTIPWHTLEWLPRQTQYHLNYGVIPQARGEYQWEMVNLRTEAPLGLFRCHRQRSLPAHVLIYPKILALKTCPILEEFSTANALSLIHI